MIRYAIFLGTALTLLVIFVDRSHSIDFRSLADQSSSYRCSGGIVAKTIGKKIITQIKKDKIGAGLGVDAAESFPEAVAAPRVETSNDLQTRIENLETEVLDLKTIVATLSEAIGRPVEGIH